MWGAEWISFRNGAADDEAILQRLSNADLAPVNALLEACILVPLQERVGLLFSLNPLILHREEECSREAGLLTAQSHSAYMLVPFWVQRVIDTA